MLCQARNGAGVGKAGEEKIGVTENRVLDTCCMMEETCAALYRCFGELYAAHSAVSVLWATMAREEENHAQQFRLAYRLQGSGIASLKTDVVRASSLLAKMEDVYRKVQEIKPSMYDAFKFAIKLEYALAEYHMDSIATFSDKNLEALFVAMRKGDEEHIRRLEQMFGELFPDGTPAD